MLDDECKPNVAVQVATKMAADKEIIAAATHYCSATAIATVDTYHKFGLPVIVWGAVLPDITYRNKYRRDPPRQRHHDQPERRQRRADLQARLQDRRRDPRHHRLRQGPQPVFQRGAGQARRQDRRHLRRHRRPAGLHRRAHPDQGAQSGGDLFRRADADRRAHPLADGQARHQGGVRRHLGHRVRRLHPGSRPAGRGRARVPRRRADREAAGRQVLHGEIHRAEIRQPARGLWRLRLCRHGPDPRHDREGRTRPQEGHRRARRT